MGQCYSVELQLNLKDIKKFIDCGKEYIKNSNAIFGNNYPINTVDGIVKNLLAAHQGNFIDCSNGLYKSNFNASYGWETILYSFWLAVAPTLTSGSYIIVYPDKGRWRLDL